MRQQPEHSQTIGQDGGDPADRLEQALNRIAYALDRGPVEPKPEGPDLHALGANIDALCARIRDMLKDGERG